MTDLELKKHAVEVRKGIIIGTHAAKSGHPGGSLSATEAFTYLYFEEMNIDPKNPKKADRDRFVLSKGHTAPGLYSVLAERGYFPKSDLETLRHIGSHLQGHPCIQHTPGVDMSSGSLGQGISAAVGMALSAKLSKDSYRVYTLLGDGEIEEGQVWEAALFAGFRGLDNVCWIIDNNNLQIDGAIDEINSPYPIGDKFKAFNFNVIEVDDGHDFDKLRSAFDNARNTKGKPSVIILKTVKGKGVSFMENVVGWHGVAPKDDEAEAALKELKGSYYFGEPDVVVHLAWRKGFVHYADEHKADLPLYCRFIKKMAESDTERIAVMGTMHEVGFFEGSIKSDTPCHPESFYGIAKNALREYTRILCGQNGKKLQWLRAYYIVGNSVKGSSIFSKISEAAKNRVITEGTRKKISDAHKGKPLSAEHIKHLSESHKGNPGYWTGKQRSDETRKKISNTLSGRKLPSDAESVKKRSDAQKGKHRLTKEQIEMLAEARRRSGMYKNRK
mgnify:CR=1 FL=1